MSSKRFVTLAALLVLISVLAAVLLIMNVQNRQDYDAAMNVINDRQSDIIATNRPQTATVTAPLPTITPVSSVTPLSVTLDIGSLVLPTKVH